MSNKKEPEKIITEDNIPAPLYGPPEYFRKKPEKPEKEKGIKKNGVRKRKS